MDQRSLNFGLMHQLLVVNMEKQYSATHENSYNRIHVKNNDTCVGFNKQKIAS